MTDTAHQQQLIHDASTHKPLPILDAESLIVSQVQHEAYRPPVPPNILWKDWEPVYEAG